MRVSVSSLLVLTLSALGKAAPVQDDVPALPNGAFTGINNADGTTTLTFVDTNEVFTFKPTAPPPLQSRNEGLNSRAAIGPTDCWRFQGALNRQGVDSGVQHPLLFGKTISGTAVCLGS
nr:uncharacterized protein CTRU02_07605 [Colletotrichum truncatum]KAF6791265.1 hypothetical protein CTRU02_07605 [Colletotrichum truncatum]